MKTWAEIKASRPDTQERKAAYEKAEGELPDPDLDLFEYGVQAGWWTT